MDRGKNANQKGGAGSGAKPGNNQNDGGNDSPKDDFFNMLKQRQKDQSQPSNEKDNFEDQKDSQGANVNGSHRSIHGSANSVYVSPQKPQISFLFAGNRPEGGPRKRALPGLLQRLFSGYI